jgi:hypothetical protein
VGLALPHGVAKAASASTPPELYYGYFYNGAPDIGALENLEAKVDKHASLAMWYEDWVDSGQNQAFPTAQMEAIREHGAIPVLSWQPIGCPLANIANGAYDAFLRQWAAGAVAWGHPFFLRFAIEMNGNWEPWSPFQNGNVYGLFARAWRHVHDIFVAAGAKNVTWLWCPNTDSQYTWPLEDLWPGASYVDWVGLDGYNFAEGLAPWMSFNSIFQETYNHVLRLIPPSMPIMIGETGSVEPGGSKPDWITDALTTQLPGNYPRIQGMIWFNAAVSKYDLSITTSPQSLSAFGTAIARDDYQANNYGLLDQSPIPMPENVVLPPTPVSPPPTTVVQGVSGPAFGQIRVVNVSSSTPLSNIKLVIANGTGPGAGVTSTELTDASGQAPVPKSENTLELAQVIVHGTIIYTKLDLHPWQGYEIRLDPQADKIIGVVVHISATAKPTQPTISPAVILGLGVLAAVLLLFVIARVASSRREAEHQRELARQAAARQRQPMPPSRGGQPRRGAVR